MGLPFFSGGRVFFWPSEKGFLPFLFGFCLVRLGSVLDIPLANQLKGHAAISDSLRLSSFEEMELILLCFSSFVLLTL